MCGIAGWIGMKGAFTADRAASTLAAMRHRGPDDSGEHRVDLGDSEVVLLNARLAILDLSPEGHLPMSDAETGSVLAYNGELYNHRDIRASLGPERWRSSSDTETLLRLLRRRGLAGLRSCNGMFAFAHWDAVAGDLVLARDRAGEKPLYWSAADGGVVFASEVRTLLATGLLDRRLDTDALDGYLTSGFVTSPETLVHGVKSLPPGSYLRLTPRRTGKPARYWFLPEEREPGGAIDAVREEARELLGTAITQRTLSDRPVGVFLSSGLDSVTVAAHLAKSSEIRTITLASTDPARDEGPAAAAIAARLGTRHTEISLDGDEVVGGILEGVAHLDQPSFDGINSALVSQVAARAGLTVMLAGVGGDELFGGYPFLRYAEPLEQASAPVVTKAAATARRWLRRGVGPVSGPAKLLDVPSEASPSQRRIAGYVASNALFPSWTRAALLPGRGGRVGLPEATSELLEPELRGRDALGAWSVLAWRLFLGERVLRDVDAVSMAQSIEVRTPYTDVALVELVTSLPGRIRAADPPSKGFQRSLLGPDVLELVSDRKVGFTSPVDTWASTGEGLAWMRSQLTSDALDGSPFDTGTVDAIVAKAAAGHVPVNRVWALAVLSDWRRRNGLSW